MFISPYIVVKQSWVLSRYLVDKSLMSLCYCRLCRLRTTVHQCRPDTTDRWNKNSLRNHPRLQQAHQLRSRHTIILLLKSQVSSRMCQWRWAWSRGRSCTEADLNYCGLDWRLRLGGVLVMTIISVVK